MFSKSEKNGQHFLKKWWPSCFTIRKLNHTKSEQNLTNQHPNMFGIPAPTVFHWIFFKIFRWMSNLLNSRCSTFCQVSSLRPNLSLWSACPRVWGWTWRWVTMITWRSSFTLFIKQELSHSDLPGVYLLWLCSSHGLVNWPFDDQATLDHWNTGLVCYSDSHLTVGIWNPT